MLDPEELKALIAERLPDVEIRVRGDGRTLDVGRPGSLDDVDGARASLRFGSDSVVVDHVWRLRVSEAKRGAVLELLLDYVDDTVSHHGWDVPILLVGGPRDGARLSEEREHLVGRLVVPRASRRGGQRAQVDVYQWRLRRNADGEYLCYYERTLRGAEMESFFQRGVEHTGPFSVVAETALRSRPDA